jgi:hypothetical protein
MANFPIQGSGPGLRRRLGRDVRRVWLLMVAAPLLAACAGGYGPPPGFSPYLANVPYYPPPAQFVPRPELYPGRPVPLAVIPSEPGLNQPAPLQEPAEPQPQKPAPSGGAASGESWSQWFEKHLAGARLDGKCGWWEMSSLLGACQNIQ